MCIQPDRDWQLRQVSSSPPLPLAVHHASHRDTAHALVARGLLSLRLTLAMASRVQVRTRRNREGFASATESRYRDLHTCAEPCPTAPTCASGQEGLSRQNGELPVSQRVPRRAQMRASLPLKQGSSTGTGQPWNLRQHRLKGSRPRAVLSADMARVIDIAQPTLVLA